MPVTVRSRLVGYGLVQPLRRISGGDFVAAGDSSLVRSSVNQILGTRPGELPWRPNFGVDAEKYRHRNLPNVDLRAFDDARTKRLGTEIAEALSGWDTRVDVLDCTVTKQDEKITCRVRWGIKHVLSGTDSGTAPHSSETIL